MWICGWREIYWDGGSIGHPSPIFHHKCWSFKTNKSCRPNFPQVFVEPRFHAFAFIVYYFPGYNTHGIGLRELLHVWPAKFPESMSVQEKRDPKRDFWHLAVPPQISRDKPWPYLTLDFSTDVHPNDWSLVGEQPFFDSLPMNPMDFAMVPMVDLSHPFFNLFYSSLLCANPECP